MNRYLLAALLVLLPGWAFAQSPQQAVVDRSTLALEDLMSAANAQSLMGTLKQSRAVMLCPRIFKAGFIFGGSGGSCVLVARAGGGSWSAPAFYTMGSGSFGLQAGIQDSEVLMMIMTEKGLNALMNSQFKIGTGAGITVATLGAEVEGATSTALNADIIAFARSRGLFAGVSLNGAILSADSGWNRAYYGSDVDARQIVVDMKVNNPGANPLREMLSKYGD